MKQSELLYQVIQIIVFLLPVCGLIWKAATQSAKIKEIESKVNQLEIKSNSDIAEIKSAINNINVTMAEYKTAMDFIIKAINKE